MRKESVTDCVAAICAEMLRVQDQNRAGGHHRRLSEFRRGTTDWRRPPRA